MMMVTMMVFWKFVVKWWNAANVPVCPFCHVGFLFCHLLLFWAFQELSFDSGSFPQWKMCEFWHVASLNFLAFLPIFLKKIIFGVCPWCQVGFLVWQRWKEIRYKSVGTAATGLRIINFARFNVEDHHCQDLGVNQCGSHYVMRVNLLPLRKPNGFSICEKSER